MCQRSYLRFTELVFTWTLDFAFRGASKAKAKIHYKYEDDSSTKKDGDDTDGDDSDDESSDGELSDIGEHLFRCLKRECPMTTKSIDLYLFYKFRNVLGDLKEIRIAFVSWSS